ncbi:PREDICTED: uncharacterized protein LOC104738696 [Camelina sativa]|uniref:Uncharacterized protein LOC104738696 n=1 Tax=Camelina sativa TaxID=90675 RepID=A0ABM1QVV3_CAMSA|nr:PREDICTED: uncharacterized protein LOC104738696 [Camelina sativa]
MVISDAKSFTDSSRLESRGYNILRCDSLESFFLADSGALDDDKCSESAFWICSLCHMDLGGQGFDNYTTHVNSRRHQRELLLDDLPSNQRFTRAEPPRPIFTRTETKKKCAKKCGREEEEV